MIIDSHQHFWKYHPVRDAWITDDMKIIKRDFLPHDLITTYEKLGIAGCVAVQADQSKTETEFLLKLAQENDFIKGVVGWVDLRNPNVNEHLEHFSSNIFLKGIRHIIQAEKEDFMLNPRFQNGISKLKNWNLTYDILIFPNQLENACKMVAKFSETKFVIDHLAKPYIRSGKINQWKNNIKTIAQHENVYCKLSGFTTEADWKQWKYEDFVPYFDVILKAFGPNRILFGSDWPVCLLASEYVKIYNIVQRYIERLSVTERKRILGGNAINFYNL